MPTVPRIENQPASSEARPDPSQRHIFDFVHGFDPALNPVGKTLVIDIRLLHEVVRRTVTSMLIS